MIDLELELVRENPAWITVLQAYQVAQEELAAEQTRSAGESAQTEKSTIDDDGLPGESSVLDGESIGAEDGSVADSDGPRTSSVPKKRATRWVQRITKLPGIQPQDLSKIHGRLIAYDLLKCDLVGRSDGMVYQLTSTGKEILSRFGGDERLAAA